ncbi:MAG: nucleotidyltransferase family protein [Betaproteobacteria bacterium]|nr:nucleotidyltransferase family protein [Betaproteobacteria bacterium]
MKARAMILAAGRGERMRPLSDHTPKPLLTAGGKPLIVWQIEALARAGFHEIVINVAWKNAQIEAALGDGAAWQVRLLYSRENPALETAGGIAHALPLLEPGPVLIVSADVWSAFDYRALLPQIEKMLDGKGREKNAAHKNSAAHLVMVPNPPYHPEGDFALNRGGLLELQPVGLTLSQNEGAREEKSSEPLTFGNIGIYHTRLFTNIAPDVPQKLTPYYRQWVAQGFVSGERYDGLWFNVGAPEDLAALDQTLITGKDKR